MTLFVRIADPGSAPADTQGRVRTITRDLATSLRPDLPFRDAMSPRQGWDIEGIAGSGGVGARASYEEGNQLRSVTLKALWLDETAGEQEWSVEPTLRGPDLSDAARQRGSLLILAGIHVGLVGAVAFYLLLSPYINTTASVLAVLLALPLGAGATLLADRFTPPAPEPVDLTPDREAWTTAVREALEAHDDLRMIDAV